MNKILIVGGAGFLGEVCLEKLSSFDVSVIGRKKNLELSGFRNVKYYQVDIASSKDVEIFLRQGDYSHLLYMAWPPSPPHNSIDHITFAASTVAFLKAFSDHNPRTRVVLTGTIYETGIKARKIPNNFINMHPETIYGLSKKFVWDCLNVFGWKDLNFAPFCWIRLSNVYGVGDHTHKALPCMIEHALQKKVFVLNNPNAFVDFIHVDDAAAGIVKALLSDHNGVIHMGGGCGYLLRDLKNFVEHYCNGQHISEIASHTNSEFGPILDMSETCKILEYKSSVSMKQGLIKYIDFVRAKVEKNAKA